MLVAVVSGCRAVFDNGRYIDVGRVDYVDEHGNCYRDHGGPVHWLGELVCRDQLTDELLEELGLTHDDFENESLIVDLGWMPDEPDPYSGVYEMELVFEDGNWLLEEVEPNEEEES